MMVSFFFLQVWEKSRYKLTIILDFYDFQMNFLQEFPAEAGKQDRDRILPYMPGPLDTVNDDITGNCVCMYVCVLINTYFTCFQFLLRYI